MKSSLKSQNVCSLRSDLVILRLPLLCSFRVTTYSVISDDTYSVFVWFYILFVEFFCILADSHCLKRLFNFTAFTCPIFTVGEMRLFTSFILGAFSLTKPNRRSFMFHYCFSDGTTGTRVQKSGVLHTVLPGTGLYFWREARRDS